MKEEMRIAAAKQNLQTINVMKKLTLNLVEKWRKMRESEEYAKSFCKPKLLGRY